MTTSRFLISGDSLHTTPEQHFLREVVALAIGELEVDVGIAADSAEDRLFWQSDLAVPRDERHAVLREHRRGVRAFGVVAEGDSRGDFT